MGAKDTHSKEHRILETPMTEEYMADPELCQTTGVLRSVAWLLFASWMSMAKIQKSVGACSNVEQCVSIVETELPVKLETKDNEDQMDSTLKEEEVSFFAEITRALLDRVATEKGRKEGAAKIETDMETYLGLMALWMEVFEQQNAFQFCKWRDVILQTSFEVGFNFKSQRVGGVGTMGLCFLGKLVRRWGPGLADKIVNLASKHRVEGCEPGYIFAQYLFCYGARSLYQQDTEAAFLAAELLHDLVEVSEWTKGVDTLVRDKWSDREGSKENRRFADMLLLGLDMGVHVGRRVRCRTPDGTVVDCIVADVVYCHERMNFLLVDTVGRKHRTVQQKELIPLRRMWPATGVGDLQVIEGGLCGGSGAVPKVIERATQPSGFTVGVDSKVLEKLYLLLLSVDETRINRFFADRKPVTDEERDRIFESETVKEFLRTPGNYAAVFESKVPKALFAAMVEEFYEKDSLGKQKSKASHVLCMNQITSLLEVENSPLLSGKLIEDAVRRQLVNFTATTDETSFFSVFDQGMGTLMPPDWKLVDLESRNLKLIPEPAYMAGRTENDSFSKGDYLEYLDEVGPDEKPDNAWRQNLNLRAMKVLLNELLPEAEKTLYANSKSEDGHTVQNLYEYCLERVHKGICVLKCRIVVAEMLSSMDAGDWWNFAETYLGDGYKLPMLLELLCNTKELREKGRQLVGRCCGGPRRGPGLDWRGLAFSACHMLNDAMPRIVYRSIPMDFRSCSDNEATDSVEFYWRGADYVRIEKEEGEDDDDFWLLSGKERIRFQSGVDSRTVTCGEGGSVMSSRTTRPSWPVSVGLGSDKKLSIRYFRCDPNESANSNKRGGRVLSGLVNSFRLRLRAVKVGGFGRFLTGCGILTGLLQRELEGGCVEKEGCLPLAELWVWFVYLASKCSGSRRLKLIRLLQQVLTLYDRRPVLNSAEKMDLSLLTRVGFKDLCMDLWESEGMELESGNFAKTTSKLLRSLLDLFYLAEGVASRRNETADWLTSSLHPEQTLRLVRAFGLGVHLAGAIGLAIGLPNQATEVCRTVASKTGRCGKLSRDEGWERDQSQPSRDLNPFPCAITLADIHVVSDQVSMADMDSFSTAETGDQSENEEDLENYSLD